MLHGPVQEAGANLDGTHGVLRQAQTRAAWFGSAARAWRAGTAHPRARLAAGLGDVAGALSPADQSLWAQSCRPRRATNLAPGDGAIPLRRRRGRRQAGRVGARRSWRRWSKG